MKNEIFEVKSGYSKDKTVKKFRRITFEEAKALVNHCYILDRNGNYRQVKINGKVKTWRRDPNRIEIPCKYGMYEYFTLTERDYTDLLIEVI